MLKVRTKAFTLVELLVVIGIIGVLVALLLPAVQAAREAARRASCRNNLKQIGIALHNYHDSNQRLPMGWVGLDLVRQRSPLAEGHPGWGWAAKILPFLERINVSDNLIHDTLPITHDDNYEARGKYLPEFRCPSDTGPRRFELSMESDPATILARLPVANYVGVFGTVELDGCAGLPVGTQCRGDGVLFHNSDVRFADIKDGLSNTIAVGERGSRNDFSTWLGIVPDAEDTFARILGIADHPPNTKFGHLDDFRSFHPAGTNFVLGDGSVRLIKETIDIEVYQALATRSGNESISAEF
jgi:prepilin-type N-terminal cleavage/methylation domain-containing protein